MPAESPSRPSERDSRDRVDQVVQDHQFSYSISQLRLVGLLLLLALFVRIALVLAFGLVDAPLQRFANLTELSHWLPLLPLAYGLCFLAGGRRRLPAELPWLDALHISLLPLGLACLLALPAYSVHESIILNSRRTALEKQDLVLQARQMELITSAREAASGADVAQLSRRAGITLPMQNGDSAAIAIWRLEQAISARNAERLQREPLLSTLHGSGAHHGVLGLYPATTTALLSAVSGAALLLLHQQSRRQVRGHGLSPAQFFRSDAMGHGERDAPATRHSKGRLVSRRRR